MYATKTVTFHELLYNLYDFTLWIKRATIVSQCIHTLNRQTKQRRQVIIAECYHPYDTLKLV